MKKRDIGNLGETLACEYLVQNGYKILCRNFYCRQGEIDIIASKEGYIVFVEVKTRCNFSCGKPAEAVDRNKRRHLYNTAKYYLFLNRKENAFVRFDVIEVVVRSDKNIIHHIKQIM